MNPNYTRNVISVGEDVVSFWTCKRCGAIVAEFAVHDQWHTERIHD